MLSDSRPLQRTAMTGLLLSIALMALVSLNPYFMWNDQKVWYAATSSLLVVSLLGCFRSLSPSRVQLVLCTAFSVFLLYLSMLPKVEGAPTRWFFLIPFTVALLSLSHEDLRNAFDKFYWLFVLSLIPGILVWIWLVAGLPLEVTHLSLSELVAVRRFPDYLGVPGAVFLPASAVLLPNGGVMVRLCAVYDEPGTVGTIAALCLAATRFRIHDARGAITLIAGIMSFSLAFAVLTAAGFIATAIAEKKTRLALAALASIIAGIVTWSGVTFENFPKHSPKLTVREYPGESVAGKESRVTSEPTKFGLGNSSRLRFALRFDNRAEPEMRTLLKRYAHSSPQIVLFGIASNASIVYGHESSVWYSVLTDYGLVGFVWLFLLYAVPVFLLWRTGRLNLSVILFCTLYLMSFYQRPVIWLPAQMLIYFAGIYWLAHRAKTAGDARS